MAKWQQTVQQMVAQLDDSIRRGESDDMTLARLAESMGYSQYHTSRRFRETAGISFRQYLQGRRLAFALRALRDSDESILSIALRHGFSSHAAFTRAFKRSFGITPAEYRKQPVPLALRTVLRPFDCYLLQQSVCGGKESVGEAGQVSVYFVHMPAHRFLHIRNYESIGYWDFWQRQAAVPGLDCETVCGILDSIPHKLDDLGGSGMDSGSGQLMGFLNHPAGRICSWGIPLAECYGVRLPADYSGPVPAGFLLSDIEAGEYVVYEHGPFDYETQSAAVEAAIERAMQEFDLAAAGCTLDLAEGRVFYFYHDCERYFRYVRPVKRL
ncbi:MAG: helix-turn-helix transcriptional regulator [Oscillospiraceae bacterium]|nr:helix-turn-helix transcriptional regulator [Oscillospiraceae bacterium]